MDLPVSLYPHISQVVPFTITGANPQPIIFANPANSGKTFYVDAATLAWAFAPAAASTFRLKVGTAGQAMGAATPLSATLDVYNGGSPLPANTVTPLSPVAATPPAQSSFRSIPIPPGSILWGDAAVGASWNVIHGEVFLTSRQQ